MGLVRTVAPVGEPVLLDDARDFLRLDNQAEDILITSLITAGRERCEQIAERALITQTWKATYDEWPCDRTFRLPRPPLQSVTSITYTDIAGNVQTLDPALYVVDTTNEPGYITPSWLAIWPVTRWVRNAVAVTFVAGYGNSSGSVPNEIQESIKVYVAHRFENRTNFDQAFCDSLFERFFGGNFA